MCALRLYYSQTQAIFLRLSRLFSSVPFQELTYQMATLTAELGNLRDVMQGLSNTIYDNTNILEQIIRNNEEVLNKYEYNR